MVRGKDRVYHDPTLAPTVEDLRTKKFGAWRAAENTSKMGFCEWEDCFGKQSVRTLNVIGIRLDLCRKHFEQMIT